MARIRTVKPEMWSHPKIANVSRDARLTFVGLLNQADDVGRCELIPRLLLGAIFPYDHDVGESDVLAWISELAREGLVRPYEHRQRRYLCFPGWSEHQRVDNPSKARCPDPEDPESKPLTCEFVEASDSLASASIVSIDRNVGALEHGNVGASENHPPTPDPANGSAVQSVESGADDADTKASTDLSPQGLTFDEAFEKWWDAYPQRNGKKVGKGNARAEFKKLTWEQRRRAYWGAVNLAKSDTLPKDPERFLRKSSKGGEFPFDDWQQPGDPPSNGSVAKLTGLAEVF